MKTFKTRFSAVLLLALAAMASGCAKGDKGEQGLPGAGRIVSTINCQGTVSGLGGASSVLNGLEVEYDAVLTSNGDVYATGTIIDDLQQVSGTSFFAAGQNGSQTARVFVTNDQHGTADGGLWQLSLDRVTLQPTVIYDDASLGGPVNLPFTPAACSLLNW